MVASLAREVEGLGTLNLLQLRELWRERFGAPPPNRSTELLQYMLAWRIQSAVLGGLDRDTIRALKRTGAVEAEGKHLGEGATIRREWQGSLHEVAVANDGFSWNGRTYKSLSAVARAITGTRWNGPRFFGLRDEPS